MKMSPSTALKITTSLAICLMFAPYGWRFGWTFHVLLFLVLSIAGIWGFFYRRDVQQPQGEQDWELYLTGFCMSFIGLTFLGIDQFRPTNFARYSLTLWFLVALVAAVATMFGVVQLQNQETEKGKKMSTRVLWPLIAFGATFGVLLYCNGAFDFRAARFHSVSIQDKRISSGKGGRGPLLQVDFWRDQTQSEEVRVSRSDWERARIGGRALVKVRPGILGAEWVEATRVE